MYIGIDFGTSKSVVGVWDENKLTVIPDSQGRRSMPSLVMVAPDERLYIGWDALNHPSRYQGEYYTISSIKRLIGKTGETSWGKFRTYPQEVSALILGRLKMQAELYCGSEITRAVIAVPAHYDINQRWATIQAAEVSGFKVCRLVNKATAAVLAYTLRKKGKEGVALVFDFGGGTLDVSILQYGDGVYEVKATSGDGQLGGDDFDEIIFKHLMERIKQEVSTSIELNPMQRLILKECALRAKIELSEALTTRIYLPSFISFGGKYRDLDISLNRKTAENLWNNLFERAESILRQALRDSGYRTWELTDLLLVGGTSRIPSIQERIKQLTELGPITEADPEVCVVQGASILAGVFAGKAEDTLLLDVIPRSYSLETLGGFCTTILLKNTIIPTKKSQIFSTTTDNQTEVTIRVFEGERETPAENTFVGELHLTGLPPSPKGIPQIEVTFDIDANNVLTVSAEEKASGQTIEAAMEAPYRMNPAQIKVLQSKVRQELQYLREIERDLQEKMQDARLKDRALYSIKTTDDFLVMYRTFLGSDQASLLSAANQLIRDYLDRNISRNEIMSLLSSVNYAFEDVLISLILSELRSLASPEFAQWVNERITSNPTPTFVNKFLEDFDKKFLDNIGVIKNLIRMLFQNGDVSSIGQVQERLVAKVKDMPTEFFLLAIVLSRYAGLYIPVTGLKIQEIHSRFLFSVFLLNELRSSCREAAVREIFDLYEGTVGIQECLRILIEILEMRMNDDVKIRLITLVASSHRKIVIVPLIRVLADESPTLTNTALIALEKLKSLMEPDICRFFELFKRVFSQKKSIRFHEKFFLKKFAKEHKDLGDVVEKLMKKE